MLNYLLDTCTCIYTLKNRYRDQSGGTAWREEGAAELHGGNGGGQLF